MKNKKTYPYIIIERLLFLLVGFFNIIIILCYKNINLSIIVGILSLIIIFIFLLYKVSLNRQIEKYSEDIENVIDSITMRKDNIDFHINAETFLSKICHKLKRLYEILNEECEKSLKEKIEIQELVSDVSHQVKTPITNLKMINSTILREDVDDSTKSNLLNSSNSQLDKLEFLMDALIKASRLETGVISLIIKEHNIYDTIAEALGQIVFKAEDKNINIEVQCDENFKVNHDKRWTVEAIFNILDNAVKYTPQGGTIRINVEPLETYMRIEIRDTGIGIPEEHLNLIFKRFYREESVHNIQGVGIGLYVAREIITRQGGYIKVASKLGDGSTFTIFLLK